MLSVRDERPSWHILSGATLNGWLGGCFASLTAKPWGWLGDDGLSDGTSEVAILSLHLRIGEEDALWFVGVAPFSPRPYSDVHQEGYDSGISVQVSMVHKYGN